MTRVRMLAAVAAAVLACGQGARVATAGSSGGAGGDGGGGGGGGGGGEGGGVVDPTPSPPPDRPRCKAVTVVLRGVDGGPLSTFDVPLAGIDVSQAGTAHDTTWRASGALSLAAGDARLLTVPVDGCGVLDVTVHVGPAHVCQGASCLDAGLCGAPISFRFDPARVDPHTCQLAVRVDLGRSVQPLAAGAAFLPNLSIRY